MRIEAAKIIETIESVETGKKVKSLMAAYNGAEYELECIDPKAEKLIREKLDETGLSYIYDDNTAKVILQNTGSGSVKMLNIFKFIKETLELENPFEYFNVKRIRNYCAAKDGSGETISFFDFYI